MTTAMESLKESKIVDITVDNLASRYTFGDMLGEGRFSRVFSGTNISSGAAVALKGIDISTLEDEEAVDALNKEVTALRRAYEAERTHVVRLHEVIETPEQLYLVLDCVEGSELFELVEQGPLAEPVVRTLMRQLVSALAALHGRGVAHCDVKPENLMVNSKEGQASTSSTLTIIDFGYAALLDASRPANQLQGLAGSPEYAAPEVLAWLEDDNGALTRGWGGRARLGAGSLVGGGGAQREAGRFWRLAGGRDTLGAGVGWGAGVGGGAGVS